MSPGLPVTFVVPEFSELCITRAAISSKKNKSGILCFEQDDQVFPLCHLNSKTKNQHQLFLKLQSQQTSRFKVIGTATVYLTGFLNNTKQSLEDEEPGLSFLNLDPDLIDEDNDDDDDDMKKLSGTDSSSNVTSDTGSTVSG